MTNPRTMTRMALIAAVYAVLTLAFAPISFGPLQIRIAEAMTILPFLFPEAIWGLFIGCFISNTIGTMLGVSLGVFDIVFGSLATLLAAYLTSKTKKIWLAPLPPVIVNAVVIGTLLTVVLAPEAGIAAFPLFAGEVALGQILSCFGLGIPLLIAVKKLAPGLRGN
ncbi:MAG: QueT transporter family protein [Oscillospiraceae bacterium]|nr:QueT transporter family protein [Oscillospiraceae bacterium]